MTILSQEHSDVVERILTEVLKLGATVRYEDIRAEDHDSWDSIAQVNIIAALESEFDIFVDTEEAEQMNSFNTICEYLVSELS